MISRRDGMVEKTQQWLNDNYGGKTGYDIIPVTGITGWTTIYALLHALQIELGITSTANNFGPSTIAKFNARFPNGIQQQDYPSDKEDNIYGIIQGALWCKGYSTGASTITKHFYDGTGNGIKSMKESAGCSDTSSTVTLNVMKALMSMTQFEKVKGGSEEIRTAQQEMNRDYEAYIGLSPCDGLYSRDMNKAMIKVLQAIEGYSVEDATGNFGAGTKEKLPIVPSAGQISEETEKKAIKLLRYSLLCNGYNVSITSDLWDTKLGDVVEEFQGDMRIEQLRVCTVDTWMALLLSKGNPDRPCVACDTRFEMTDNRLDYLKRHGYEIVGRYLTGGTFKGLRVGEAERIIEKNLLMFCIFQESGTNLSYFTSHQGKLDAIKSVKAARELGIPGTNVIYYAVDTDPTDSEITEYIIPYFKSLSENIDPSYIVGIYGTRNVCTQIVDLGYAKSCFVSDMSTGFSGNMGFKMPKNWGLDQFHEIKNIYVAGEEENMDLDKVAYSGKLCVINEKDIIPVDFIYPFFLKVDYFTEIEEAYISYCMENRKPITAQNVLLGVTNFLRSFNYDKYEWMTALLSNIDNKFVEYFKLKKPNVYDILDKNTENGAFADGFGGYIDISHLAATLEGYIRQYSQTLSFPAIWLGWAGDLATLMKQVDNEYVLKDGTKLDLARKLIARKSKFGFLDMCSDADAIGLSSLIIDSNWLNENVDAFSLAIKQYYAYSAKNRIQFYLNDLPNCEFNVTGLTNGIKDKILNGFINSTILNILGGKPTDDSIDACCQAFAEYIYENY